MEFSSYACNSSFSLTDKLMPHERSMHAAKRGGPCSLSRYTARDTMAGAVHHRLFIGLDDETSALNGPLFFDEM